MIDVGDPVHYRAYASDLYEAEVIRVHGPELIDIRCSFPGTSTTLGLGNSLVPQIPEIIGRAIMKADHFTTANVHTSPVVSPRPLVIS
jgi:hypothetical protein